VVPTKIGNTNPDQTKLTRYKAEGKESQLHRRGATPKGHGMLVGTTAHEGVNGGFFKQKWKEDGIKCVVVYQKHYQKQTKLRKYRMVGQQLILSSIRRLQKREEGFWVGGG